MTTANLKQIAPTMKQEPSKGKASFKSSYQPRMAAADRHFKFESASNADLEWLEVGHGSQD